MKNIKTYEDFANEEINWKGMAAGAMSFLATACSNVEIHDKSGKEIPANNYSADGMVSKIDTLKHSHPSKFHSDPTVLGYRYTITDKNGNEVIVDLDDDVVSTGDSVTVSVDGGDAKLIMKEEDCKDPSKCFPLPHHHIKGANRQNPEVY